MQAQFKVVDLFSGCGGLALGARAAGFGPELAFDIDPILTSSFRSNFADAHLINSDLSNVSGHDIRRQAGGHVLGVFGGPPCQAFSSIGKRNPDDPRRQMLWHFFRIVSEVQPTFFLMENVRGLGFADSKKELEDAMGLVASKYHIVGPVVLDAADFGAATKRQRLFVVGFNSENCDPISAQMFDRMKSKSATVADAIADLGDAVPCGIDSGFDVWKLGAEIGSLFYRARLRSIDRTFTGHRPTVHTDAVVARFSKVLPGGVDLIGRHPRLAWQGQCPTLRAGTGSDRGSFQSVRPIHPDLPRVITVREAARLQGFPDWFRFHPTVWHSFRMIGNSVSPIIAQALFSAISEHLELPKTGIQVAAE